MTAIYIKTATCVSKSNTVETHLYEPLEPDPANTCLKSTKKKTGPCPVESIELPGTRSMGEKGDDTPVSRLLKRKKTNETQRLPRCDNKPSKMASLLSGSSERRPVNAVHG